MKSWLLLFSQIISNINMKYEIDIKVKCDCLEDAKTFLAVTKDIVVKQIKAKIAHNQDFEEIDEGNTYGNWEVKIKSVTK